MPRSTILKAVVDSGPLFSVLALNFANTFDGVKRDKIIECVIVDHEIRRDKSLQKAYLNLFASIRKFLTTSHVIGELQGLQSSCLRLTGDNLRVFWSQSISFLDSHELDEQLFGLLVMAQRNDLQQAICQFGPTDIGLIALAQKEGCLLLTEDRRTLASHAWNVGVNCQMVKDLLV